MKARVFVTLKPSVFDPQGSTIAEALHSLGYDAVSDVRQGKYFELDLRVGSATEAERLAAEVADKVLANPIIESFRIELVGQPAGAAGVVCCNSRSSCFPGPTAITMPTMPPSTWSARMRASSGTRRRRSARRTQ